MIRHRVKSFAFSRFLCWIFNGVHKAFLNAVSWWPRRSMWERIVRRPAGWKVSPNKWTWAWSWLGVLKIWCVHMLIVTRMRWFTGLGGADVSISSCPRRVTAIKKKILHPPGWYPWLLVIGAWKECGGHGGYVMLHALIACRWGFP